MQILIIMSTIVFIISFIIMVLTNFLSKKIEDREKSFPFECGFDPISSSCLPFSLQFFLIAMIVLIFDIEFALILPMTIIPLSSNMTIWTISSLLFLLLLIMGLYHKLNQSSLQWAN